MNFQGASPLRSIAQRSTRAACRFTDQDFKGVGPATPFPRRPMRPGQVTRGGAGQSQSVPEHSGCRHAPVCRAPGRSTGWRLRLFPRGCRLGESTCVWKKQTRRSLDGRVICLKLVYAKVTVTAPGLVISAASTLTSSGRAIH